MTDLIAIWTCNLAAFCGSLFLTHFSRAFLRETPSKCPWLPSIAITSEKLGFWLGFGWSGRILFCWCVCPDFVGNVFRKFFSRPKNIFRIFFLQIKFSRDFLPGFNFFRLAMTGAFHSQTALWNEERLPRTGNRNSQLCGCGAIRCRMCVMCSPAGLQKLHKWNDLSR